MLKKLLVVATVVALSLVTTGCLPKKPTPTTSPQVSPEAGAPSSASEEQSFSGKLKDALGLGQAMKCTWKKDDQNFATAYLKGRNVYTEATMDGEKGYSLVKANCLYFWQEGKTEGVQLCSEPSPEEDSSEDSLPEEFSTQTPDVDYRCERTDVPDSRFDLPAGITFTNPLQGLDGFTP